MNVAQAVDRIGLGLHLADRMAGPKRAPSGEKAQGNALTAACAAGVILA